MTNSIFSEQYGHQPKVFCQLPLLMTSTLEMLEYMVVMKHAYFSKIQLHKANRTMKTKW
ncbi:hypothetical protein ACWA1C_16870 [Flectobacillus roseus]